jgi:anti-sigma regulatory factor (Ser/Thr protein kinase)
MKEKNFAVATIVDFQTAFAELAVNAFTYGCSSDRDYVQFRAVIFGSGISFEIANRKTLIAANLDEIKQKTRLSRGITGRGPPLVYSLADQFEFVSNGRGIKIVMFDHDRSHALCEENGIRLVTVGNYLGDFIEKIRFALTEVRGDVIVIFSEKDKDEDKGHRGHIALSIAMRSLDEVEQVESVDRFAVVLDRSAARHIPDLSQHFSKFKGFYPSIDLAIAAMKPASKPSRSSSATRRRN